MAISLFKSAQTGLIFRPLDFNTNMQIIEEAINALQLVSGATASDELAALVAVDAELLALAAVETDLSALAAKDTELLAIQTAHAAGKLFGSFGNNDSVVNTDSAAVNLLDAVNVARQFIAVITVDEAFASDGGAATVIQIGDGTTADMYLSKNTGTAAEQVIICGKLLANKPLVLTPTAATGTGTGGVSITVLAVTDTPPVVA